MKVSYPWLQTYFDNPLPKPDELADLLTFHSFEMEGVSTVGCNPMLDIDVLPNRSSDCLCHRGIAKELSVLLSRGKEFLPHDPLAQKPEALLQLTEVEKKDHRVSVEATEKVHRFSTVSMKGVSVKESPEWLKAYLETIGQKSINNVVDATNVVMFNVGQPLHAFDASKLAGNAGERGLRVRVAKNGEKITTLSGDELSLDAEDLLIADVVSDAPLGIAGVKGGKQAEIDNSTTDIILEAANFHFVSVRKTSRKLKLVTDASVRFQNQPSKELTLFALRDVVKLIQDIAGGEVVSAFDWNPEPVTTKKLSVSLSAINQRVGTNMTESDVSDILSRFDWVFEKQGEVFVVEAPWERTDLNIEEDLIEEIGRVYGYLSVTSQKLLPLEQKPEVNALFALATRIRAVLSRLGFSEVYTYVLRGEGEVELANALASDKNFMRKNLTSGMQEALLFNTRNAPILGLEKVKLFEVGPVFTKEGEATHLSLGVAFTRKFKGETPDENAQATLSELAKELGITITTLPKDGVVELALSALLTNMSAQTAYAFDSKKTAGKKYQPTSPYPFMLRDIALWAPEGTEVSSIRADIEKESGDLLVRLDLFDEFHKEGRVSFAFHLVFQSNEKTLTDAEVGGIMERITARLTSQGFEVR